MLTDVEIACGQGECTASRMELSTEAATVDRARAAGWHIWTGETVTGVRKTVILCPDHSRGRRPGPPPAMEGEQTLW